MKKSDMVREKIFNTSYKLFIEEGYENTTTRQIAEASNIKHGLLYYYFKKKEDILVEIVKIKMYRLTKFVMENTGERDPYNVSALFGRIFFEYIKNNDNFKKLYIAVLNNYRIKSTTVDTIIEISKSMFNLFNIDYKEENLRVASLVAVGVQSTLVVSNLKENSEINYDELVSIIIKVTFGSINISDEKIKIISEETLIKKEKFIKKFGVQYSIN
ncbi:TetR/AcrR family transcriptional regulator [Oceanirhabdus seepicola]|uniref:TetR/AcrR family transcriptional regulator n=1 Tax=Oceanirhabdus seepicola TaxID=2828781 RepID=A0A9J6NW27_9CLOT|nr:TetR/AcrR family transcriptional regulator [Oceanirhabdus seepicola]MCM1988687.1 TetR/AcrR family transcriptional regulator [Oceanirhabdus seepicola]